MKSDKNTWFIININMDNSNIPGKQITKIPTKGSTQWKTNESIIAKNPVLRRFRDMQQGFKPSSSINTGVVDQQYKDNYDKIQWGSKEDKPKPLFRTKVNGRYIDEEE